MLDGPKVLFCMSMAASFSAVRDEMTAVRNGTLREDVGGASTGGGWCVYDGGGGGGGTVGVACTPGLAAVSPERRNCMGSGWYGALKCWRGITEAKKGGEGRIQQ